MIQVFKNSFPNLSQQPFTSKLADLERFVAELKRRNVYKVAVASSGQT
jgi:hypothetical protein